MVVFGRERTFTFSDRIESPRCDIEDRIESPSGRLIGEVLIELGRFGEFKGSEEFTFWKYICLNRNNILLNKTILRDIICLNFWNFNFS